MENTISAMLKQLSVVAPVCDGTLNSLINMNSGMERIKETTAEIHIKKPKDHGVIPQITTRDVNFVLFPGKRDRRFDQNYGVAV